MGAWWAMMAGIDLHLLPMMFVLLLLLVPLAMMLE
jgi:hypothetical protein